MRHVGFILSLALAVVWLGSGAGPAGLPRAAGDSAVQAVGPGQVPAGLNPAEWQRIQAQVAKLIAADGAGGDYFGYSASVSGDTAVVGAHHADVGDNSDQGAAYVFCRDQGGANASVAALRTEQQWGQVAELTAGDGATNDYFGVSVSVSGDTAVVGADSADVDGNSDQGAAYVFYRDGGSPGAWGQVAKLTAGDGAALDFFGRSVSVSGDTAVVGATAADGYQGAAYVFYRDGGGPDAWGQVAKLTAADGVAWDGLGSSVSLDGDTAVIGATGADVGGHSNQGAAYVFYRDQGGAGASVAALRTEQQWGEVVKLTAADGAAKDWFGSAVSVSGDTAVVGACTAANGGNSEQGAAYVFYRNQGGANTWGQVAKLIAADGAAWNWFGFSVSVSGDTVVVGAHLAAVGGNARQGAAYVFSRDQGGADASVAALRTEQQWGQAAKLTAADGAADDRFGVSVSISGDTVVVGALANVSTNVGQGTAYVHLLTPYRVYLPLINRNCVR